MSFGPSSATRTSGVQINTGNDHCSGTRMQDASPRGIWASGKGTDYLCVVYLYALLFLISGRRPVTLSTQILRFFCGSEGGSGCAHTHFFSLQRSRIYRSLHCNGHGILLFCFFLIFDFLLFLFFFLFSFLRVYRSSQ